MKEVKSWTVIFFVDQSPATKVVLLKRSPNKSFAPNYYTGIGGKIGDLPGHEDETPLESAYRELHEETEGQLDGRNTTLTEFARCKYESGLVLHYFWGVYGENTPPHIDPNDGMLVWVSTDELFDREIIPTTQAVCEEWSERGYRMNKPFTVHVRETGTRRSVRLVEKVSVDEGLK